MKKWFGWIAIAIAGIIAIMIFFGPYENTDFEHQSYDFGNDLDGYLDALESQFSDITPGTQKHIEWAAKKNAKTPIAIVYIHGYSATNKELEPVPSLLGQELGANVYHSRLTGHGRDGEALASARVTDWYNDLQEALAIGREIGEQTIIISSSTGGTLAALAAIDPKLSESISGIIFISPNFKINNPLGPLLTWPAARTWLPKLAGEERVWEPANELQKRYWTWQYPSSAVFPMAAMVKKARKADYSKVDIPALFYYSPDDKVVEATQTDKIVEQWGGDAKLVRPELTEEDDEFAHVVVGEILSPNQTEFALSTINDWVVETVK